MYNVEASKLSCRRTLIKKKNITFFFLTNEKYSTILGKKEMFVKYKFKLN